MHDLPGPKPGPSACKLIVQTTTPPVLDTILIEQQPIILPRKSQDRLGKHVCKSLEIRIKLELAPTSTLRIGTIN